MVTSYTQYLIMFADVSIQDQANQALLATFGQAGKDTFTYQVGPTKNVPSASFCQWHMTMDEETKVRAALDSMIKNGTVRIYDGNSKTTTEAFTTEGVVRYDQPIAPKIS